MFNQSRFLGGLLGIIYFVWISSALGCSKMVSARLYDMESGAVSEGTFHFKGSTHGRVELQLPSGELLVGEYNTIPGGVSGWGQIYSTVWSGTISPNALIGTAIATSDAGTILDGGAASSGSDAGNALSLIVKAASPNRATSRSHSDIAVPVSTESSMIV